MQLSEHGEVGGPCVSLDGKHLLFVIVRKDGSVVYLTVSTATGEVESEYPNPSTTLGLMSWMPDNHSVAVRDTRSGDNLWALRVLGGGPEKQITHYTTGNVDFAQYSPDGKWVVMERGANPRNAVLFREASQ